MEKPPSEKTVRVLVVDDDGFISDLLSRFLSKEGYAVQLAADGESALEILDRETVDIALIDLMLDGMDGMALINEIAARDLDLIMIMMTGHPTLETALEAMKKGVQDYLIKPFKLEQLAEVIRRSLIDRSHLLEIQRLRHELEEAREQIKKYESLMRHGHMLAPVSGRHEEGGGVSGLSAYKQSVKDLSERQAKLEQLKAEGVISEEEFKRRWKRLHAMKSKGY